MSHVRCPLCGRDCAVSVFDPSKLDRDIYTRQVRRASRGFDPGPDESVLGDDIFTPMIKDRCLDLIRLFMENGIISSSEVTRELKIGVPINGSDDVVSYEKMLEIRERVHEGLNEQVSALRNQVSQLRLNTVSKKRYNELREAYEELNKSLELKKRIDKDLSWLHTQLNSEIILLDDDWALKVKGFDLDILPDFCKLLYSMRADEKKLLQDRIIWDSKILTNVFDYFLDEPCIDSVAEQMTKKPNIVYYLSHGLQVPEYSKDDGDYQDFIRETYSEDSLEYLLYSIVSGKPRLLKYA
jgi:hypothetical protein